MWCSPTRSVRDGARCPCIRAHTRAHTHTHAAHAHRASPSRRSSSTTAAASSGSSRGRGRRAREVGGAPALGTLGTQFAQAQCRCQPGGATAHGGQGRGHMARSDAARGRPPARAGASPPPRRRGSPATHRGEWEAWDPGAGAGGGQAWAEVPGGPWCGRPGAVKSGAWGGRPGHAPHASSGRMPCSGLGAQSRQAHPCHASTATGHRAAPPCLPPSHPLVTPSGPKKFQHRRRRRGRCF